MHAQQKCPELKGRSGSLWFDSSNVLSTPQWGQRRSNVIEASPKTTSIMHSQWKHRNFWIGILGGTPYPISREYFKSSFEPNTRQQLVLIGSQESGVTWSADTTKPLLCSNRVSRCGPRYREPLRFPPRSDPQRAPRLVSTPSTTVNLSGDSSRTSAHRGRELSALSLREIALDGHRIAISSCSTPCRACWPS